MSKSPRLAPNGQYVYVGDGGAISMAPDGTYVAGKPRLAPNGKYVGGTEPISLAPDGSYVAGKPHFCPNGKYI